MKFIISKDELHRGLQLVQSVADKKSTMPILSNVLIAAKGDGITLTATDLEIGVRGGYKADVKAEGGLTISARKLFEIVRELPSDEVTIESTENNWAVVTSGKSEFKFTGLAVEEFPELPAVEEAGFFTMKRDTMREFIKRAIFAAADNDTRYVLNGIYMALKKSSGGIGFEVVGTDGHRLAVIEKKVEAEVSDGVEDISAIIPKKSASELRKLLGEDGDEEGGTFEMALTKNHIVFKSGSTYMVSRLIEGSYPNYSQVIPADNDKQATVSREALVSTLRRVSLLSRERTHAVKFEFGTEEGTVISSQNPEMGEAREVLDMEYSSDAIEVGFNAKYLLDALNVMGSEKVNLLLKDSLSPCVVSEEGDDSYRCVVMPLRV
jgi:DNA polymerase-3 subunit beta